MTEKIHQCSKLQIIKASEIKPRNIEWLWYPFIPFGKVTPLLGDVEITFMLTIVALLTRGKSLPFTESDAPLMPINVIYQTTEDDANDTIIPLSLSIAL